MYCVGWSPIDPDWAVTPNPVFIIDPAPWKSSSPCIESSTHQQVSDSVTHAQLGSFDHHPFFASRVSAVSSAIFAPSPIVSHHMSPSNSLFKDGLSTPRNVTHNPHIDGGQANLRLLTQLRIRAQSPSSPALMVQAGRLKTAARGYGVAVAPSALGVSVVSESQSPSGSPLDAQPWPCSTLHVIEADTLATATPWITWPGDWVRADDAAGRLRIWVGSHSPIGVGLRRPTLRAQEERTPMSVPCRATSSVRRYPRPLPVCHVTTSSVAALSYQWESVISDGRFPASTVSLPLVASSVIIHEELQRLPKSTTMASL